MQIGHFGHGKDIGVLIPGSIEYDLVASWSRKQGEEEACLSQPRLECRGICGLASAGHFGLMAGSAHRILRLPSPEWSSEIHF